MSLSIAPVDARAAEDDAGLVVAVGPRTDRVADDPPGVLAEAGRLQARCPTTRCGCSRSAAAPRRG